MKTFERDHTNPPRMLHRTGQPFFHWLPTAVIYTTSLNFEHLAAIFCTKPAQAMSIAD